MWVVVQTILVSLLSLSQHFCVHVWMAFLPKRSDAIILPKDGKDTTTVNRRVEFQTKLWLALCSLLMNKDLLLENYHQRSPSCQHVEACSSTVTLQRGSQVNFICTSQYGRWVHFISKKWQIWWSNLATELLQVCAHLRLHQSRSTRI